MPARADVPAATTSLLTIDAGSPVWAIASSAVENIEPFADDDDASAVDVRALLGGVEVHGQARRVITVQASGRRLRLLARGALLLRSIGQHEIVPLPAAFERSSALVSHVALVDGKPSLLVVSAERLLSALPTNESLSSLMLPHRPEATPC